MELFGIPGATLVQGGLGSFGLLCILLILTGRLIPVRTHEREMARSDKRGDDWHAAYQAADARADERGAQMDEMLSILRRLAGRQR